MSENVLIPLAGFRLPADFPWQVGFVAQVNEQLRRLRATGHFLPPRFFGYYFQGAVPMAVGGSWTVTLDAAAPITLLPAELDQLTRGKYSIVSAARETAPEFVLVQDCRDGTCWLWSFAEGVRFIEAVDPVIERAMDVSDQKLLGP